MFFDTTFDEKQKLWSGSNLSSLINPHASLGYALLRSFQLNESKVAQVSDDSKVVLTYSQIYTKTVRAAKHIQKLGFERKDIFCFVANNDHHLAPIVFASLCLGCTIQPLAPNLVKSELIHMLKLTEPKLMFCDVEIYVLVKECLRELNNDALIYTFGGKIDDSMPVEELFIEIGDDSHFIPIEVDGMNDIAVIICSSGTSGPPKGVCLSHAIIVDHQMRCPFFKTDGILFSFSGLYYMSGFRILIAGSLVGSRRVITKQSYTPDLMFRIVQQHKITCILSAPYQMITMLKHSKLQSCDLSSIKLLAIGANKTGVDAFIEMNKYLPNGIVSEWYSMTEVCSILVSSEIFIGRNVVGKLMSGSQVKIVDDDGNRLDIGKDGEVCIKTPFTFSGYYRDEESTRQAIDSEGFFLSGDIGHFDREGYLCIVDRKKDLIRYSGCVINPSEIEMFLMNSLLIKEACIVGIQDGVCFDLPAAVVVCAENSNISEQDVFNIIANNFDNLKTPRGGVYFVDGLPKTRSGKILRRQVKLIAMKRFEARKVLMDA